MQQAAPDRQRPCKYYFGVSWTVVKVVSGGWKDLHGPFLALAGGLDGVAVHLGG